MRTQTDISAICAPNAERVYPTNDNPINVSEAERVCQGTPTWDTIKLSEAESVYPTITNTCYFGHVSLGVHSRVHMLCFGHINCVQREVCLSGPLRFGHNDWVVGQCVSNREHTLRFGQDM